MCVCVCVCVCVYTCACARISPLGDPYVDTQTYICVYARVRVRVWLRSDIFCSSAVVSASRCRSRDASAAAACASARALACARGRVHGTRTALGARGHPLHPPRDVEGLGVAQSKRAPEPCLSRQA